MYGAFDHSVTISNLLVPGKEPDASAGNILSEGYQIASKGSVLLFISEKIYNLDELRLSLNFPSGNAADLVSELIHREGVMGCRRLNGKSTIILRENENTTIIRDRNGEGPMVYFTKDFFTDSYQGLFRFKNFKAEPDLTGITTFMKIGYIPAPVTSLAGVSKVPAGEILFATKAGFRFEKLFDFDEILHADRKEIPLPEAIETYSDLLKKSLNRRIGDVFII